MSYHTVAHPYSPGAQPGPPTALLVWDAPNIDMGLGAILGGRPPAVFRPRFDAVGRWLIEFSRSLEPLDGTDPVPEATVFTNVAPGGAEAIRSWVEAMRNTGFAVFAKPKAHEDSDVDPDMLAHIERRRKEGVLAGLVVASADGRNFQEELEALGAEGIPVTVLGFHERASWALESEALEFIDLEEIPGVFREPLPRVHLDALPDEGAWLQPLRPLTALLDDAH